MLSPARSVLSGAFLWVDVNQGMFTRRIGLVCYSGNRGLESGCAGCAAELKLISPESDPDPAPVQGISKPRGKHG